MARDQMKIAHGQLQLERSRLLPEWLVGYSNQTLRGIGADDRFYGTSTRFQSVQVGLGIPLFFGYQHQKIQAARAQVKVQASGYDIRRQQVRQQWLSAWARYHNQRELVEYIETTQWPLVDGLERAASQRLTQGDIDYIEWVLIQQQVIQMRMKYWDALQQLNESIIEINYLTHP